MSGPLTGIRVVDLSSTLTGAQISQTLADFGCEVVLVEPPKGNPLRKAPAWPFLGRGKRSLLADLTEPADLGQVRDLIAEADVVVETWRPGVAERIGLGYDELSAANPILVYCSVTGFGRDNPLSHYKAYEPIVLAKMGALDSFSLLSLHRPGPSFVNTPYSGFSASMVGTQGVLAALYEREESGLGQHVEATMIQSLLAHDTWNWLVRLWTKRYPDAFQPQAAASKEGSGGVISNSPLFLRLMVGFSEDARYMQFSQMSDRLWNAFLRLLGLDKLVDDPEWTGGRAPDDPEMRLRWHERALEVTRSKTYDEWLEEFDRDRDVWAEVFRDGTELLHHPQLVHDGRVETLVDPGVGPVLQPGPIVKLYQTPAQLRPAPLPDADRAWVWSPRPSGSTGDRSVGAHEQAAAVRKPPLDGVTVIELGTFYAAPFGSTLLTDLGARVIKVEQIEGDPIRYQAGFPELGAIKVLQGKESVAVDIASDAGREIVYELVRRADAVLQSFRAGVARRHGYTASDLRAINPELVYLNAPGYGVGEPYGDRPAFAPTIGAGAGLAYRNLGGHDNIAHDPDAPTSDVRVNTTVMSLATLMVGTADGFSALGVATALLVGLLAKKLGGPGQEMTTSMLSTMAHCLGEDMIEYQGRKPIPVPTRDLFGLSARYRLYEAAEGWVFLAAPQDDEWRALAAETGLDIALGGDDGELVAALAEVFRADTAANWERRLTAVDVACVEVATGPVEEVVWFTGGLGETLGITTSTTHPMLDEYPRLAPAVRMSRSTGVTGPAPLCGEQTDTVLAELGYDASRVAKLRASGVIG